MSKESAGDAGVADRLISPPSLSWKYRNTRRGSPGATASSVCRRIAGSSRALAGRISTGTWPATPYRRRTMPVSRSLSRARYGQTSQSCRGPLLLALMVQTPLEFSALTHSVALPRVSDRKGHRPDFCCLTAAGEISTIGNTRWPYHSEMWGRDTGSRGARGRRDREGGWVTFGGFRSRRDR